MNAVQFERTRPSDYLTRLAASDWGRAYKSLVIAELDIRSGNTVLDLGCGPGADLTAFAGTAGPAGTVIGLDHDEQAVELARASVAHLPTARADVADIHSIALPDMSVDRVHTDRVLQHVADPRAVLCETRRVLRPDGRAVFAEPDWDTLTIDYPEPAVPKSYREFITERVVRNANIGRQLPRIAGQADFTILDIIPLTAVFRDAGEADQIFGFHRVTTRAIAAGYLGEPAAAAWLDYLRGGHAFLAAMTLFVTVAAPASDR
jgi:ubiquinone/menaquinone biosynthesis C-methylase UbiE